MLTSRWRIPALLLVLALVAATLAFRGGGPGSDDRWEVAADFADTTGVYVGNEVQYLGVPVGEITRIEPRGTVMRVHMEVDADIRIPRDARAQIMQSALLTDRYVELGPVFEHGPALEPGATIGVEHTRSPVSFDALGAAIDALVVALDREGPDGRDIGDLVHVTAKNLDGNGERLRRLVLASRDALAGINRKEPDLQRVARNLAVLARVLGRNDATVRRFTHNMAEAADVVAGQTEDLDETLASLTALTTEVSGFVEKNRTNLTANLADVAAVTATIRGQQAELARIFDYLPTGAENIARAFDPQSRSLRVQLVARNMAFFSPLVRQAFCQAVAAPLCPYLTNDDGTGALDLLLDGFESMLPGSF